MKICSHCENQIFFKVCSLRKSVKSAKKRVKQVCPLSACCLIMRLVEFWIIGKLPFREMHTTKTLTEKQ